MATRGEKLVGLDFNPSGDPRVRACKEGFAGLIDQMDALTMERPDLKNMAEVAVENMITAQMWAVKALTWK